MANVVNMVNMENMNSGKKKKVNKKKWACFLVLAAILCFAFIQYFSARLSRLENVVLAGWTGEVSASQYELIKDFTDTNRNIEAFSMYSDYRGSLGTSRGSYNNILVCMVDGNYKDFCNVKLISGRFFWDTDYETRANYIVIEKAMASAFFSTHDCIGREVELNGKTFKVIGVYEKGGGLIEMMSAVGSNHVFIPYLFPEDPGGMYGTNDMQMYSSQGYNSQGYNSSSLRQLVFFRVKNNLSSVLTVSIHKNLEGFLRSSNITIENVDFKVRQALQKIKTIYFIIVCIAAVYLLKWLIPVLKRIYGQFKEEMHNYYFVQLLIRNWLKICAFLLAVYGYAAMLRLVLSNIRPALIIDPEFIPLRFINTREVVSKISEYFIKANTEQRIVSSYHAFVNHVNGLLTYLGFVMVLCCWRILHNLDKIYCSLAARYKSMREKSYNGADEGCRNLEEGYHKLSEGYHNMGEGYRKLGKSNHKLGKSNNKPGKSYHLKINFGGIIRKMRKVRDEET